MDEADQKNPANTITPNRRRSSRKSVIATLPSVGNDSIYCDESPSAGSTEAQAEATIVPVQSASSPQMPSKENEAAKQIIPIFKTPQSGPHRAFKSAKKMLKFQ